MVMCHEASLAVPITERMKLPWPDTVRAPWRRQEVYEHIPVGGVGSDYISTNKPAQNDRSLSTSRTHTRAPTHLPVKAAECYSGHMKWKPGIVETTVGGSI